jgi:hypothetical protein
MIDYKEIKTFHIDQINGSYQDWENITEKSVYGFPIKINRNQYELMKLCKFNARRTNNRNYNLGIALAFVEAMENMFNVIEEEVVDRYLNM